MKFEIVMETDDRSLFKLSIAELSAWLSSYLDDDHGYRGSQNKCLTRLELVKIPFEIDIFSDLQIFPITLLVRKAKKYDKFE